MDKLKFSDSRVQKSRTKSLAQGAASVASMLNIENYTGPWDRAAVSHFLRRTTLGHTYNNVTELLNIDLESAVDLVLADGPMPSPPVNYDQDDDPAVPIGETWVETMPPAGVNQNYRARSMRAWSVNVPLSEGLSVRERMVVFWHNHFVTSNINDRRLVYDYLDLIRGHALGNFNQFVKDMTIDHSMLRYLNGKDNTKTAPNENYARELLELFTIGKGPLVAAGDYTNYTEDDIISIARVLTGWRTYGFNSATNPLAVGFDQNRHDTDSKQLSYRFDNVVIENEDAEEYKTLIDVIFQKDEVARFICRKLYRYFVSDQIDASVEQNLITPLAQLMVDNDYEIKPTLKALFMSNEFMQESNRGVLVKNPLEFMASIIKSTKVDLMVDDFQANYNVGQSLYYRLRDMQMEMHQHDSVAGWPAYYQAPGLSRMWLSAVSMPHRMYLSDRFTSYSYNTGGNSFRIDVLALIAELSNPYDPNILIEDLAELFYPISITENQVDFLKSILIPGLPDFEWTEEYANHIADPDDQNLMNSVDSKLRDLISSMMSLSEFYLF
jgi:uncharacterized protein (DUF1800 family)